MAIKVLRTEQFLPIGLEKAWDFFSSPKNLNEITPEDIIFKILSDLPDKMYAGLIINYKVAPVLNIPLAWTTEITQVVPMQYFVDEQRKGPYNIWHHEHHFEAVEGGVIMRDILHYDIGRWLLGDLLGALFIHKKVSEIFDFRFKKLETMFGKK